MTVYDEQGHVIEEQLPDPDGTGPVAPSVVKYDYDERDRLVSKTVELATTPGVFLLHETYAYDPVDRLLESTEVLQSATSKNEYDAAGNMTATVDAENRRTTYTYDGRNLTTDIQQPHPVPASSDAGPLWHFDYDQLGRLITRKDPLLRETKYEYDRRSQLTKVTLRDPDGAGVGNPAPFTSYAYTNVGDVDFATDQIGRVTNYDYNPFSELTRVDLPDPDGAGPLPLLAMSYSYDRMGRRTSSTDQRGQVTTYAYNAAWWLTSITQPDPDGPSPPPNLPAPVTQLGYDANGRLRTQDELGPNGGTLRTEYRYDTLGRSTSVIVPQIGSDTGATATTQYDYDGIGRMVSTIDPLGNVTTYAYNSGARTVTVTEPDPDGTGPKSAGQTVSTYDKVGNWVQLKDASNNVTQFAYDRLNRLTSETDPFGKQLKYEYDFAGNLTRITDRYGPNGRKRDFTYDALDRVTKETWRSATTGAALHSMYFDFDSAGRLSTVKELRGPQSGTPNTEYVYAYDNLDRLTSVTDTANSAANSTIPNTLTPLPVGLNHTFNTLGDLSQTSTTINGLADFNNAYQYDNLARMTQVVQAGTAAPGQPPITRKRVDIAYNPAGQFQTILRSSGPSGSETEVATSDYTYFDGGGLKQIAHTHSGAPLVVPPSGGIPISPSWTYDTAGRVSSFTAPEGTFAYGYDNTHQLTSATFTANPLYSGGTPPTESFNFDATGNRQGTGHLVDKNRLLSDGTYNYTYDNEGNRLSRTEIATGKVINYTWDHRNRLVKVEFRNSAGGPVTKIVANSYDAFDHRVMKQVDDNADGTFDRTERYVWDGEAIALVLDLAGNVLHRFLHGPSIDQIFADESAVDGLLWDLTDNQGTVRDVIDNSGTVVNHLTYSAFGVLASESNAAKTPFYAYTGRDWDEDLGLQYNRSRWYEPSTGRWLSEDQIRFAAGDVNLQRYVGNHPANATDPSGLDWLDCMVACIKANDPIQSFLDKALLALAGQALPKAFVASLADFVGDPILARRIRAGGSRFTTIPSVISARLRLGGRSALRALGRFASPIQTAYGLALAAVEVHCAGYCTTAAFYGMGYDPACDRWR